jgi:DNA-binding MarR family transcriptional regulator
MERSQTEFAAELLRLTRRCRGIDKHVSASVGLSIDEVHCLSVLFSEKPSSVKTLSGLINVSSTRASKILRDLELRGFLSRTLDVSDHRKEHVVLTDDGKQTVERLICLYYEIGTRLLGSSPGEFPLGVSQLLQTISHQD